MQYVYYILSHHPHRRTAASALLPYIMSTGPWSAYSAGLNQALNQSRPIRGGGNPLRNGGAVPRSAPRWPRLNSPAIVCVGSGTGFWHCSSGAQGSAVGRAGRHTLWDASNFDTRFVDEMHAMFERRASLSIDCPDSSVSNAIYHEGFNGNALNVTAPR